MTDKPTRRNDPTRQTPMEQQIRRLVQQMGTEFDPRDQRIAAAMRALVAANDSISDYVDNVS